MRKVITYKAICALCVPIILVMAVNKPNTFSVSEASLTGLDWKAHNFTEAFEKAFSSSDAPASYFISGCAAILDSKDVITYSASVAPLTVSISQLDFDDASGLLNFQVEGYRRVAVEKLSFYPTDTSRIGRRIQLKYTKNQ